MTMVGMIVGTPQYMSPEQITGQPVDARSDIFSVGAVAYELLTGRQAFGGDNLFNVSRQIVGEQPRPIESFVPDVPQALVKAVAKCLQKDPASRAATAKVLEREFLSIARRLDPDHTLVVAPAEATIVVAPAKDATTSRSEMLREAGEAIEQGQLTTASGLLQQARIGHVAQRRRPAVAPEASGPAPRTAGARSARQGRRGLPDGVGGRGRGGDQRPGRHRASSPSPGAAQARAPGAARRAPGGVADLPGAAGAPPGPPGRGRGPHRGGPRAGARLPGRARGPAEAVGPDTGAAHRTSRGPGQSRARSGGPDRRAQGHRRAHQDRPGAPRRRAPAGAAGRDGHRGRGADLAVRAASSGAGAGRRAEAGGRRATEAGTPPLTPVGDGRLGQPALPATPAGDGRLGEPALPKTPALPASPAPKPASPAPKAAGPAAPAAAAAAAAATAKAPVGDGRLGQPALPATPAPPAAADGLLLRQSAGPGRAEHEHRETPGPAADTDAKPGRSLLVPALVVLALLAAGGGAYYQFVLAPAASVARAQVRTRPGRVARLLLACPCSGGTDRPCRWRPTWYGPSARRPSPRRARPTPRRPPRRAPIPWRSSVSTPAAGDTTAPWPRSTRCRA